MPLVKKLSGKSEKSFLSNRRKIINYSKILIILILSIILIFIFAIFNTNFFDVKEIVIVPDKTFCVSRDQIAQDVNLKNKKLLLLNDWEIERNLKEKFLCIEQVKVVKVFPNQINLEIKERVPMLKISLMNETIEKINLDLSEATPSSDTGKLNFSVSEGSVSANFIVDNLGFIFSKDNLDSAYSYYKDFSNLPLIYFVNFDFKLGTVLENRTGNKIVEIINKLNELRLLLRDELKLEVKNIKVLGNNVLVDGNPRIIFSLIKDNYKQLASLQLILQKATIKSAELSEDKVVPKPIELIDFRFEKVVVRYSPKR